MAQLAAQKRKPDEAMLRNIEAQATRFELRTLLRLLASYGYSRGDTVFHSNSDDNSGAALIHGVRFDKLPARRVTIVLNMGLLGPNGLLPSYFAQIIEQAADPSIYYDFVHFFDHLLLDRFMKSAFPEDDETFYEDYGRTKRQYFRMLGLSSISTLQWLFPLYFPELQVRVERKPFQSATESHAFRTGVSHLDGTGIVGRRYESIDEGFSVELFAEEETHDNGQAWPHLVKERLDAHVLPLLRPVRMPLMVALSVLSHATWARMQKDGFLGYERFRTPHESGHRIVVHSGYTGV